MFASKHAPTGCRLCSGAAPTLRSTPRATNSAQPRSLGGPVQVQHQCTALQLRVFSARHAHVAAHAAAPVSAASAAALACPHNAPVYEPLPAQLNRLALVALGLCLAWRCVLTSESSATALGSISLSNSFSAASQTGDDRFFAVLDQLPRSCCRGYSS